MSSGWQASTGRVGGGPPDARLADLGADDAVHQRRLAGAGRADERHEQRRGRLADPGQQVVVDLAEQLGAFGGDLFGAGDVEHERNGGDPLAQVQQGRFEQARVNPDPRPLPALAGLLQFPAVRALTRLARCSCPARRFHRATVIVPPSRLYLPWSRLVCARDLSFASGGTGKGPLGVILAALGQRCPSRRDPGRASASSAAMVTTRPMITTAGGRIAFVSYTPLDVF